MYMGEKEKTGIWGGRGGRRTENQKEQGERRKERNGEGSERLGEGEKERKGKEGRER